MGVIATGLSQMELKMPDGDSFAKSYLRKSKLLILASSHFWEIAQVSSILGISMVKCIFADRP